MVGAEATLVAVLCAIGRPDLSTKITPATIAGMQSQGVGERLRPSDALGPDEKAHIFELPSRSRRARASTLYPRFLC